MTWQLGSVLVLSLALALGFGWYERSRPPARVLALVAALAALAAIGRVAFAAFPNVKPTTDIVLFSGMALGGPAGFVVGAVAALVSNVFLGQGPWTPWQMAAWGLVGLAGAALGRALRGREPGRLFLAVVCGVAAFGFGAVMDTYQWTLAAEHDLATWIAIAGTSFAFNVAHAAGNVGFALLIGPAFLRALSRYRRRFEVRWRETAPALASLLLAAVLLLGPPPAPAQAADPPPDVGPTIARAARYLESAQNGDGGFGAARREASDPFFAQWAALALASAQRNPLDVERAGNSVVDYLRRHVRAVQETQDYERLVLALRAGGVSVRSFGGRDLLARLRRRQRGDGSFDRLTDRTAFGILALRAARLDRRSGSVRGAARWLLRRRNRDGGWGNAPGARSDIDNTAAVLQALGAAGRARGPAGRAAVRFLRRGQRSDGGFPLQPGGGSNSQSTAYAILAFRAAGTDPRRVRRGGRSPIGFLKAMQAGDGSIRYSRASTQTPVWVTAQALLGLEAKPLPLRPVARRKVHIAARAASTRAPAGADRPRATEKGSDPVRTRDGEGARDRSGDSRGQTPGGDPVAPAAGSAPPAADPPPGTGEVALNARPAAGREGAEAGDDGGSALPWALGALLLGLAGWGAWRIRGGRPLLP